MPDQRRSPRHRFKLRLKVFEGEGGAELGHLGDATTGGLLVVGQSQIKVGQWSKLRVEIPLQDGGTEYFELEAESRWSRHDKQKDSWLTGFSFGELPLKARLILGFLIKGDVWFG